MAIAFVASITAASFGRTIEEEAAAVRDYLNVVDAKLVKAKKTKNAAKVNLLHKEKDSALLRWNKLKASMTPTPAPAPAPVAPAPIVNIITPAPLAGRGVALYVNGGIDKGLTGAAVQMDYDLSGMVAQGLSVRIGGNYISGTNPTGNDSVIAISAKLGAIYYITPFLPALGLPLTWYAGGAYLLPVKVNNNRTG